MIEETAMKKLIIFLIFLLTFVGCGLKGGKSFSDLEQEARPPIDGNMGGSLYQSSGCSQDGQKLYKVSIDRIRWQIRPLFLSHLAKRTKKDKTMEKVDYQRPDIRTGQ
jgi:predicted small lipoprotein YifL